MVTIKDVAKLADVSPGTVSKVLNGYTSVSLETKNKVNKAVAELNYVPNLVAASLSSKSRKRIAVIISVNNQKQAIDEINMQYILAATNKCVEIGYDISIVFTNTIDTLNENELTSYFHSRAISGIIMYGISKEHTVLHKVIESEHFKTVCVDSDFVNNSTSCVTVDHYNGQYDVAKELILTNTENKHRNNVLYFAGNSNGYVTEIRLKAIKQLSKDLDFNLFIEEGNFSERMAFNKTQLYAKKIDFIVCASDLMAIGAMHKLIEMDIYRPICGYDGISLMGYAAQDMLTCVQNFYNISEVAVQEVHNLLNGEIGRIKLLDYEIKYFKYDDVIF